MKVAIIFRSQSEQERLVLDFERDFNRRTGRHIYLYDVNTRDGWAMAQLYDVMQYPAIVATEDDGRMLQLWQGENLPMLNDVMYYSQAY